MRRNGWTSSSVCPPHRTFHPLGEWQRKSVFGSDQMVSKLPVENWEKPTGLVDLLGEFACPGESFADLG